MEGGPNSVSAGRAAPAHGNGMSNNVRRSLPDNRRITPTAAEGGQPVRGLPPRNSTGTRTRSASVPHRSVNGETNLVNVAVESLHELVSGSRRGSQNSSLDNSYVSRLGEEADDEDSSYFVFAPRNKIIRPRNLPRHRDREVDSSEDDDIRYGNTAAKKRTPRTYRDPVAPFLAYAGSDTMPNTTGSPESSLLRSCLDGSRTSATRGILKTTPPRRNTDTDEGESSQIPTTRPTSAMTLQSDASGHPYPEAFTTAGNVSSTDITISQWIPSKSLPYNYKRTDGKKNTQPNRSKNANRVFARARGCDREGVKSRHSGLLPVFKLRTSASMHKYYRGQPGSSVDGHFVNSSSHSNFFCNNNEWNKFRDATGSSDTTSSTSSSVTNEKQLYSKIPSLNKSNNARRNPRFQQYTKAERGHDAASFIAEESGTSSNMPGAYAQENDSKAGAYSDHFHKEDGAPGHGDEHQDLHSASSGGVAPSCSFERYNQYSTEHKNKRFIPLIQGRSCNPESRLEQVQDHRHSPGRTRQEAKPASNPTEGQSEDAENMRLDKMPPPGHGDEHQDLHSASSGGVAPSCSFERHTRDSTEHKNKRFIPLIQGRSCHPESRLEQVQYHRNSPGRTRQEAKPASNPTEGTSEWIQGRSCNPESHLERQVQDHRHSSGRTRHEAKPASNPTEGTLEDAENMRLEKMPPPVPSPYTDFKAKEAALKRAMAARIMGNSDMRKSRRQCPSAEPNMMNRQEDLCVYENPPLAAYPVQHFSYDEYSKYARQNAQADEKRAIAVRQMTKKLTRMHSSSPQLNENLQDDNIEYLHGFHMNKKGRSRLGRKTLEEPAFIKRCLYRPKPKTGERRPVFLPLRCPMLCVQAANEPEQVKLDALDNDAFTRDTTKRKARHNVLGKQKIDLSSIERHLHKKPLHSSDARKMVKLYTAGASGTSQPSGRKSENDKYFNSLMQQRRPFPDARSKLQQYNTYREMGEEMESGTDYFTDQKAVFSADSSTMAIDTTPKHRDITCHISGRGSISILNSNQVAVDLQEVFDWKFTPISDERPRENEKGQIAYAKPHSLADSQSLRSWNGGVKLKVSQGIPHGAGAMDYQSMGHYDGDESNRRMLPSHYDGDESKRRMLPSPPERSPSSQQAIAAITNSNSVFERRIRVVLPAATKDSEDSQSQTAQDVDNDNNTNICFSQRSEGAKRQHACLLCAAQDNEEKKGATKDGCVNDKVSEAAGEDVQELLAAAESKNEQDTSALVEHETLSTLVIEDYHDGVQFTDGDVKSNSLNPSAAKDQNSDTSENQPVKLSCSEETDCTDQTTDDNNVTSKVPATLKSLFGKLMICDTEKVETENTGQKRECQHKHLPPVQICSSSSTMPVEDSSGGQCMEITLRVSTAEDFIVTTKKLISSTQKRPPSTPSTLNDTELDANKWERHTLDDGVVLYVPAQPNYQDKQVELDTDTRKPVDELDYEKSKQGYTYNDEMGYTYDNEKERGKSSKKTESNVLRFVFSVKPPDPVEQPVDHEYTFPVPGSDHEYTSPVSGSDHECTCKVCGSDHECTCPVSGSEHEYNFPVTGSDSVMVNCSQGDPSRRASALNSDFPSPSPTGRESTEKLGRIKPRYDMVQDAQFCSFNQSQCESSNSSKDYEMRHIPESSRIYEVRRVTVPESSRSYEVHRMHGSRGVSVFRPTNDWTQLRQIPPNEGQGIVPDVPRVHESSQPVDKRRSNLMPSGTPRPFSEKERTQSRKDFLKMMVSPALVATCTAFDECYQHFARTNPCDLANERALAENSRDESLQLSNRTKGDSDRSKLSNRTKGESDRSKHVTIDPNIPHEKSESFPAVDCNPNPSRKYRSSRSSRRKLGVAYCTTNTLKLNEACIGERIIPQVCFPQRKSKTRNAWKLSKSPRLELRNSSNSPTKRAMNSQNVYSAEKPECCDGRRHRSDISEQDTGTTSECEKCCLPLKSTRTPKSLQKYFMPTAPKTQQEPDAYAMYMRDLNKSDIYNQIIKTVAAQKQDHGKKNSPRKRDRLSPLKNQSASRFSSESPRRKSSQFKGAKPRNRKLGAPKYLQAQPFGELTNQRDRRCVTSGDSSDGTAICSNLGAPHAGIHSRTKEKATPQISVDETQTVSKSQCGSSSSSSSSSFYNSLHEDLATTESQNTSRVNKRVRTKPS